MQVNARAVPQAVTVQQCHLPKMGADQNIEDFIASLETALDIDGVVEDAKRKKALLTQLTPTIATSVNRQLRDTNISYEELKIFFNIEVSQYSCSCVGSSVVRQKQPY